MSKSPHPLWRLLASSLLLVCLVVPAIAILARWGFPAPEISRLASPSEVDKQLPFLLWEDRFIDLIAQAALMLLAAAVCTSAMRLWGGGRER